MAGCEQPARAVGDGDRAGGIVGREECGDPAEQARSGHEVRLRGGAVGDLPAEGGRPPCQHLRLRAVVADVEPVAGCLGEMVPEELLVFANPLARERLEPVGERLVPAGQLVCDSLGRMVAISASADVGVGEEQAALDRARAGAEET